MAKVSVTLTLEPTAEHPYHRPDTGLTVYIYNANLNSGTDKLLTESGVSGRYFNNSVDAGAYQLWIGGIHGVGTRYNQFEPIIAEEISNEGLKDNTIALEKLACVGINENQLLVSGGGISGPGPMKLNEAAKIINEQESNAFNKNFGDSPGTIPIIYAALENGKIIYGYLDGGVVKLRSSNYTFGSFLQTVKTAGSHGESIERKTLYANGTATIGQNSFKIQTNIPANVKIIAVLARVEVALDRQWDMRFEGGLTSLIASSVAYALNTKSNNFIDANESSQITTDVTDIRVASTAEANFGVAGKVGVSVIYEELTPMEDIGA